MLSPPLPRLHPKTAPPPDYYANNLLAVVAHVRTHSTDLLGSAESPTGALTELSQNACRLLARLVMRSTAVVREDSLNYAEVVDRESALAELEAASLIERDAAVSASHLIDRLKVAELKSLFPELVVKKDRKQELLQRILCAYTDATVRDRCADFLHWVTVDPQEILQRVRLAYFGDLHRDLTEFVMRDLGLSEFETYELGDSARAFSDSVEFDQYLQLAALQRLQPPRRAAALSWLFEHDAVASDQTPIQNRSLLRRRNKLLNAWGRDFERVQMHDYAHACYQRSTAHPARERRVRLFSKAGNADASTLLLSEIEKTPWCAEESLFAQRFGAPRPKRGAKTRTPWRETQWDTRDKQMPNVEFRTAEMLTRNGGQGWHTENGLLQSLLGLAFWDIVFAPEAGMFTHPFQSGPRDLYWPDFRLRRTALIEERLNECGDEDALWSRIEHTLVTKAGRMTRLVHWGLVTHNAGEIVRAARQCFSAQQLQGLFDYMLDDLGQVRSGMPDLFVAYGPRSFELVEVKGPSDQLQPNQRVWLAKLCELGIPCRVVKHRYVAAKKQRLSAAEKTS